MGVAGERFGDQLEDVGLERLAGGEREPAKQVCSRKDSVYIQ